MPEVCGPTTAERVRTVLARAAVTHVVGSGMADGAVPAHCPVRHLLPDGTFAITVERGSALAAAPESAVVVELLDRTPNRAADAVRALVWVGGLARPVTGVPARAALDRIAAADPNPALLDVGHRDALLLVTVQSIVFADATGAADVDRAAIAEASPDPFCHSEAAWVHHLEHHHPEMVERLRIHLPRNMRRGRLRVLGLDRFGLQVRIEGHQGNRDLRVPFFAPAADDAALCRALRALMGCPMRGLRPGPGRG